MENFWSVVVITCIRIRFRTGVSIHGSEGGGGDEAFGDVAEIVG